MLDTQHRLPGSQRFRPTILYRSPAFSLKGVPNQLSVSRFGFVISKKAAKQAVVRNRTKRVLRSRIEQLLSQTKSGYDLLFIIHKPFEEDTAAFSQDNIRTILEKHSLII